MWTRREVVLDSVVAIGAFACRSSIAQSLERRRVAIFAPGTRESNEQILAPFFEEMRRLGWIENRTVLYDRVDANDREDQLGRLAREIVSRKPDLIYAPPTNTAKAAFEATRTIPIVFAAVVDPVRVGLVGSLREPGRNATGVSNLGDLTVVKRLELLFQILPSARRIGFLVQSESGQLTSAQRAELERFGQPIFLYQWVTSADELESAMTRLAAARVDAIYPNIDMGTSRRERLSELAHRERIPLIGFRAEAADAGALFAFGPSLQHQLRRSATFVDRILRGASPASLPVEQPTEFDLVINRKVATDLGISVPSDVLLRATRLIE